jgi:hypothetical protein
MNEHIKTGFEYRIEIFDPATGIVRESEVVKNLMPMEGITHMQNVLLKGGSQVSNWYIGLYEGNYTPVSGDTMADFPVSATEFDGYSEATRQLFVAGTPALGVVDNVNNEAIFTFTEDKIVYGGFIGSSAAKGSASGILLSAVRFGSPKSLSAGEALRVIAGFITASA